MSLRLSIPDDDAVAAADLANRLAAHRRMRCYVPPLLAPDPPRATVREVLIETAQVIAAGARFVARQLTPLQWRLVGKAMAIAFLIGFVGFGGGIAAGAYASADARTRMADAQ